MKNNKKIKEYKENNVVYKQFSMDELIEIHTEAFYRAQKRLEQDKIQSVYTYSKIKKNEIFKLIIQLLIKPKHINKEKCADGLLMILTTLILDLIGYCIKFILGLSCFIYPFLKYKLELSNLHLFLLYILLGITFFAIGGIFLAASKDIEKMKDSNYLITYCASLMGILAVILALIALLK